MLTLSGLGDCNGLLHAGVETQLLCGVLTDCFTLTGISLGITILRRVSFDRKTSITQQTIRLIHLGAAGQLDTSQVCSIDSIEGNQRAGKMGNKSYC